ncbi:MAG: hypothetical protein CM15mP68_4290 [Pseudomonadota bacterium]|nr:MAG: hypothetical protein CM15mP68_4290 [Pseudomonadota bacterium]
MGEDRALANVLASASLLTVLAVFFVAGVGLTFTPCVFPMLPILSSIIVGQGEGLAKSRALSLSSAYVLGMAVTFASVGLLVGPLWCGVKLTGQTPVANGVDFFGCYFCRISRRDVRFVRTHPTPSLTAMVR